MIKPIKVCVTDDSKGVRTVMRGVVQTDGVLVITSEKKTCSNCFGRGYIYGPTNAYPITEAMEEPEVLECHKCHGTGSTNAGNGRKKGV
jgi:hypothetical protein